jgi:hypothetical protein
LRMAPVIVEIGVTNVSGICNKPLASLKKVVVSFSSRNGCTVAALVHAVKRALLR